MMVGVAVVVMVVMLPPRILPPFVTCFHVMCGAGQERARREEAEEEATTRQVKHQPTDDGIGLVKRTISLSFAARHAGSDAWSSGVSSVVMMVVVGGRRSPRDRLNTSRQIMLANREKPPLSGCMVCRGSDLMLVWRCVLIQTLVVCSCLVRVRW
jgi:hypothetical protein